MHQDDFKDQTTNICKKYKAKTPSEHLVIINVDNQETYDFYRNINCAKGNVYANYCEYCGKESCLYFSPEVNLVPVGQGQMAIMSEEEENQYSSKK